MSNTTRRNFMSQAALGVVGTAVAVGPANARPLPFPPGVQLWTVKEEMARDLEGTLRAVAKLGFKQVEAAGWHGRSPRVFRDAVRSAGLDCVSAHYPLKQMIADPEGTLTAAKDVGVRYVIAATPLPPDDAKPGDAAAMTLADWHRSAEAMNRIGQQAKRMGLRFGYHNHAPEFVAADRHLPLAEIVRLTDPALVSLELDVGWVAAAGYDPVEVIDRFAARIRLLHIKDIPAATRIPGRLATDKRSTAVGEGSIDWPAVFLAARRAPIDSYFVEQEPPFVEPPLQALAKSIAYLRRLKI